MAARRDGGISVKDRYGKGEGDSRVVFLFLGGAVYRADMPG